MSEIQKDENIDVRVAMVNRMNEIQHGDVVTDSNGVKGIVIDDKQYMIKQQEEAMKPITDIIDKQRTQIEQAKSGQAIEGLGSSEADKVKEQANIAYFENSNNGDAQYHLEAIKKLSEEASKWEPTSDGLAPANSKAAEMFNNATSVNENGSIDLGIDLESLKQDATNYAENQAELAKKQHDEQVAQEIINEYDRTQQGDPTTMQFNVPEGKVQSFITTLPKDVRGNVSRTKSIVVNEVKRKTVPTSTRTITSITEFKNITKMKHSTEVQGVTLPNSGFYAVFKGSGSMNMASILPDRPNQPIDYAKRYQFCYDCLESTSIGRLSYSEFCAYVAVQDLDLCIMTILRASEPDEQTITLVCGEPNCKTEYNVKFKYSQLLDIDSVSKETWDQIKKIADNKDVYENAKAIFQQSPVMTTKTIDIMKDDGDILSIEIKPTSGSLIIERTEAIRDVAVKFNQYISALLVYIPRIYYTTIPEGESQEVTYEIEDAEVIANIIADIDDESLDIITKSIANLNEYIAPTYSFKGNFECPTCHRREDNVACDVNTLVFQKVRQAIR